MHKLKPVHPGEILLEEFLSPLGISQYALAKAINVPPRRINEIVHGKRGISADTDLRLCRYFGLSEGYWLRGQVQYDTEMAKDTLAEVLTHIPRCPALPQPAHA
ncbi:Addiction module antidote protein, HigA family [Candidatus Glomeribacter gigasporarum BEG34]|uniref:Addiction module antidote protein, HigA family n=1 Tax=Candidatus Glomeribacter gigasporarum BEG34 TaxID=1070319 RepID=G2JAX4_9BURK|nr:HigA family addiction module antitoxin [Candidatus Glomeribacter gigasporarum]CCD29926.1 Addiction module antidote protein, HigA family [Candidatus Glomeribacter gigasporarum BEG34]